MKEIKLENIRLRDNTEKYASRKHRESDADFSSAGLKIGLCIALCIGLCIVNLTVGKGTNTAYTGSDDVQTGKLRFVQLPGMIEVFAGGDRLTMPVDYESVKSPAQAARSRRSARTRRSATTLLLTTAI